MSTIVIPLPSSDFDPTEAAVTWKTLIQNKIEVIFSTANGQPAAGDHRMLTGNGLGILSPLLRADINGRAAYNEMTQNQSFKNPIQWTAIKVSDFDGIVLPGGHAPGMKPYLESKTLQTVVSDFFEQSKLIGAICHGVVLAARSHRKDGKSILTGRQVTTLLRSQELAAWGLTCLWLGNYYRTYPETVQSEVTQALGDHGQFITGSLPLRRDSTGYLKRGFVVEDGTLITARWPGDAHLFGQALAQKLKSMQQA